jgi:hypothetical protein
VICQHTEVTAVSRLARANNSAGFRDDVELQILGVAFFSRCNRHRKGSSKCGSPLVVAMLPKCRPADEVCVRIPLGANGGSGGHDDLAAAYSKDTLFDKVIRSCSSEFQRDYAKDIQTPRRRRQARPSQPGPASCRPSRTIDRSNSSISATRYSTLPPSLRYRGPSRSQRHRSRVRGLIFQRRARSVWFRQVSLTSVFSSFAKSSANGRRREKEILSRSPCGTWLVCQIVCLRNRGRRDRLIVARSGLKWYWGPAPCLEAK